MGRSVRGNLRQVAGMGLLAALFIVSACKDENAKPAPEPGTNEYVNSWIKENMEFYYLWNDDIPSSISKSKAPDEYFDALLSPEDRFSWIQENYIELLNSLQGVSKEAGYEFKLYLDNPSGQTVIAQVMYIKPGSSIDLEGLDFKRGDLITHINDELITTYNYQTLLAQTSETYTIRYERPNEFGREFKGWLTLNPTEYAENPNFMDTVIEIGDHKIGYYVYNFFATGPTANSLQYNIEMDAVFADFKSQGITDLVLDLRYNSGGAEGATINLASLIGSGVDGNDVFTKREYNSDLQEEIINDPTLGTAFLVKKFTNKSQNIGTLDNNRVYILTSSRTASASELLINGLKPFMDVFLIGDVTVGKNVGSISIYETDDPNNTWGLQPIVVKSYNSLDQSDYSDGFIPNVVDLDNDINLVPLGNENERLLSIAIEQITGGGARKSNEVRVTHSETLGSSADFKRGSYNLVIDDDQVKKLFKRVPIE